MLKVRREGDTVRARADRASCPTLTARIDEALVRVTCAAAGVPRGAAEKIRDDRDSGDEPWRVTAWRLPGGATLELRGAGVASGHGIHGEVLRVVVAGLPPGVTLSAGASVDMRHGGDIEVTLRGAEGLDELVKMLGPEEP